MIERKRESFILNEAKNVGNALALTRLFNEIQDEICRLQPIDGNLNKLLINQILSPLYFFNNNFRQQDKSNFKFNQLRLSKYVRFQNFISLSDISSDLSGFCVLF